MDAISDAISNAALGLVALLLGLCCRELPPACRCLQAGRPA
jgi:hypothetical protein